MADSKVAAVSDKNEKSNILDDDIGEDILSSWKSISVIEDAADFKLEPIGKSKKKDFSFVNLDMDFDLGGDFGKMSSFKMDMSDLDFSFPTKKNKSANETTEGDSGRVNFQGKEDQFNFSFDFNSLGNFDIDATLSKVDTLSRKQKDIQKLDIDETDCQASEIHDKEVTVADISNKPKRGQASENVAIAKVHDLVVNHDTLMRDNQPMRSEVSDVIVLQPDADISSDEAVRSGRADTSDHSYSPVEQPIIQNFGVQTTYTNNLGEGNLVDSLKEGCFSGTGVNSNVGDEQSICYNKVALEAICEKSPECVPPEIAEPIEHNNNRNKVLSDEKEASIYIEEVFVRESNLESFPKNIQSKTVELSKEYNDRNIVASNTFSDFKESSDDVSDSHDTSTASVAKRVNREMATRLSPLSKREPLVDKSTSGREKEQKIMRSQFFSRSDEADTPNQESSVFTEPKSMTARNIHSDSPSEIREANAREKTIGISAGADIVSHKKIAKGELKLLKNQRTLITSKEISLHIISSNSKEKSSKNESQKSEKANVSSTVDCSQSIRQISTAKDNPAPLKSKTRTLDLADLKSLMRVEEKKLQSTSATMSEVKSLKVLKQKVHENATPKVNSLILTEKQKPATPTLKRKQAPTVGLIHEIPVKRLSQSPKDNSSKNVSDIKLQGQCQVQRQNNTANKNNVVHLVDTSKIPKLDTPRQLNSSVPVPYEMGYYGNVEKAEAYGKDLDDLCSMLKKKHEEAKELLVRAVINNSNLLLLNHPMHDEMIRSVQKLANRLMTMEIAPHQGYVNCVSPAMDESPN